MRWLAAIALVTSCSSRTKDHAWFSERVGESVDLVGRVATTEWQHMTKGVPGKQLVYIDLDGGKHQIVAHFDRAPACSGDIAFEGSVFEVRGPSKGAVRGEREEYWEYAVDVASWRCR